MNTDLQAIMARRRRMAEGGGSGNTANKKPTTPSNNDSGNLELSLSDLQPEKALGQPHNSSQDLHSSQSAMGSNLQSIMERRRRMADGEKVEPLTPKTPTAAVKEPEPTGLQAIMARRRQIADGGGDPNTPTSMASPSNDSQQQAAPAAKGGLQEIMERRRKLADGEIPAEPTTYRLSLAPTPRNQHVSATATSPRKDLKTVGVSSEMQKIMERRRRMADAEKTTFADDKDEDASDDEDDELVVETTLPSPRQSPTASSPRLSVQEPASIPPVSMPAMSDDSDASTSSDEDDEEEQVTSKSPKVRPPPAPIAPPRGESEIASEGEEDSDDDESMEEEVIEEEIDETEAEDLEEALVETKAAPPRPGIDSIQEDEAPEDEEVAFHAEAVPVAPPRPTKKEPSRREERTLPVVPDKKPPMKRKKSKRLSKKPSSSDDDAVPPPEPKIKTPKSKKAHDPKSLASIGASRRGSTGGDRSVASASSAGSSRGSGPLTDDVNKMLPWEKRKDHPGKSDGKIAVFQRDGKGIAAKWDAASKEWTEVGEVTGNAPQQREKPRRRKSGSVTDRSSDDRSTASGEPRERRRRRPSRGAGSAADLNEKRRLDQSRSRSTETQDRPKLSGRSSKTDLTSLENKDVPPPPPPSKKKSQGSGDPFATGTSSTSAPAPADAGFDTSAWGAVPTFGASDAGNDKSNNDAAFSSGFMSDFGGGGGFAESTDTAPISFNSDAFKTDSNFSDAFGSPSAFDPAQSSGMFAATGPMEPVYNSAPLKGVPSCIAGKVHLDCKAVMRGKFRNILTTNPLNGNLICCSDSREGSTLHEVDTSRGNLQVMATSVVTPEFRGRIASKYNASVRGLDGILKITCGLHVAQGQTRVRVAAIIDLRILETKQPLRIVAVWEWGSGASQPITLLNIMSPPSGGDFSYETSTLIVADNLLFLGGQSPKGPCVFISKPSLRESWTSNSVQGSGKVASMEVLMTVDRSFPYLALALTDKSLTVWTYKTAMEVSGSQQVKRWLFPLCRLDAARALSAVEASSPSEESKPLGADTKNSGYCTSLSWYTASGMGSPMLLLSAAFQNGLAIFHVGLPVMSDKSGVKPLPEPTSGSSLKESPRISPIVAKRWLGKYDRSVSSWFEFGPHVNPCLSVLLQSNESRSIRIICGVINIPHYRRGPMTKEKLLPFRIFTSFVTQDPHNAPTFMVPAAKQGILVCHSDAKVFHVTPHIPRESSGTSVHSLWHPISTQPAGLTSIGEPLNESSRSDKDGIIHIFSSLQCERNKADSDGKIYDWSRPTRRHWIVRTKAGDNKSCSIDEAKEERVTSQFGDGETVLGGSATEVVCELYDEGLAGLAPLRVIRCPGEEIYAVLFRPSLCSKSGAMDGVSLSASVVAFVDLGDSGVSVQLQDARDVVFLPAAPGGPPRGLILQKDGLSLTYFTWEKNQKKCELHQAYRPILGVEDDQDYVECRRIFVSSGPTNTCVLAVATRHQDMKTVIVSGELVDLAMPTADNWSALLPNIKTGMQAWLESFEDVLNLEGLEGDDSGYRNFAAVTSHRVIILSSAMEVAAEYRTTLATCGLAPLGAFAVGFIAEGKIRYLCCLDGELSCGTISSLISRPGCNNPYYLLLAIRQDRIIGTEEHKCTRLIELGQKVDQIFLPSATTRPGLLLEPLVANAISIGGNGDQSTPVLYSIIEKFGRAAALAHGDNEGIGSLGLGITSRVFEVLGFYGLKDAASWLLTGTTQFDRTANTTLLPPWLPLTARTRAAFNSDALLHLLSSGDQYFSDYVKDPETGMASGLPRMSDPVAYLSRDLADKALYDGNGIDALKALDIVGSESTDSRLVQLCLVLEKDKSRDLNDVLRLISGQGRSAPATGVSRLPSAVAALTISQRNARLSGREPGMSPEMIDRWMKPLAPSLQKGGKLRRVRQQLMGKTALEKAGEIATKPTEPLWMTSCKEAKHVWNEGPSREKDKLLMLDRFEDWIGRRRPVILGKEGASAARDRGALADILNMEENSFGGKSEQDEDDGWVDGVGEGRSDEANLSSYFRFSEGDEEDKPWKKEGLLDLTSYQNKAILLGNSGAFTLETSTSSVDEGEPGKVKSLYDLVFGKAASGALALPTPRGSSSDVGVLHNADKQSRQRCTVEFWYNLPEKDAMPGQMVLARRTMGPSADDMSKAGKVSDKESVLWEIVLKSSGELVFHSCGGSSLKSSQKYDPDDADESETRKDLVKFGKWNHVCLVLSSRNLGMKQCKVSMLMMGNSVAEKTVSMLPSGFDEDDLDSSSNLNELLQKSHLLFGLNNPAGFRMTEVRVWACARSDDDVNTFMREYLNAAEGKKKFKVKIKSKKGANTLGKGLLTKPGMTGNASGSKGLLSLAPTPKMSLAPKKKEESTAADEDEKESEVGFATGFDAFGVAESGSGTLQPPPAGGEGEEDQPVTLWDTALPLSQQVRSSAAAALIRGPPATRHFGGNRGGLPDFSGMERFGVGGIAICGSEKTIVWRDNEDPPALTYPIGASGAIVSDQMDDEGSEFLCCFLARDKRMVVFELQSRTVVVELQMTTKLNFWRFLPPEAGENTLCFMLVTPVGGFHWMPLDESPRPQQVWKRGPDLAGKKVVAYEEGGSNGLDGPDILSRVGLIMVTKASGESSLESWIVPIAGDSVAVQVSDDVMGGCLCLPPFVDEGPFLPLLVAVLQIEEGIFVNVMSLVEPQPGSVGLGDISVTLEVDLAGFEDVDFEPPSLAMGTYPEAICCSLANIVVVLIRRKGLIVAFELEDGDMSLIAREGVDHYVIDAVMRYSAEVGGAEIVMLLADDENPKDGRMVSFCFRSAA